jgi:hypothetical protein
LQNLTFSLESSLFLKTHFLQNFLPTAAHFLPLPATILSAGVVYYKGYGRRTAALPTQGEYIHAK